MLNAKSILIIFPLALLLFAGCQQRQQKAAAEKKGKDDLQLDKIPHVVMQGLKAKFPQAEIHKWSVEQEGGIKVYDIEFAQEGRNFEADIKEDGSIQSWEKAIEITDLPDAVKGTAEAKYPGSNIKEIMQVMAVTGALDSLKGYELAFATSDTTEVELTVAPDGSLLEESGMMEPEEK
jgi:hypothetical protein